MRRLSRHARDAYVKDSPANLRRHERNKSDQMELQEIHQRTQRRTKMIRRSQVVECQVLDLDKVYNNRRPQHRPQQLAMASLHHHGHHRAPNDRLLLNRENCQVEAGLAP